jgi:hypothetical protein
MQEGEPGAEPAIGNGEIPKILPNGFLLSRNPSLKGLNGFVPINA